jgi:hypothetical protein
LLYRWGNPGAYGRGTKEDQKLFYQHEVRWIPEGWERAGLPTKAGPVRPRARSDEPARFLPGVILANRYRIVAPLGRGGMDGLDPLTLAR